MAGQGRPAASGVCWSQTRASQASGARLTGRLPAPQQGLSARGRVLAPRARGPTLPVSLSWPGSASCASAWPLGTPLGPRRAGSEGEGAAAGPAPQPPPARGTHVLRTAMVWHASAVQNSETVLYCRFTWWKNVVAAGGQGGHPADDSQGPRTQAGRTGDSASALATADATPPSADRAPCPPRGTPPPAPAAPPRLL